MDQLFSFARRIDEAFRSATIDYRIGGAFAVYLHTEAEIDVSGDIELLVRHDDLAGVIRAAERFGFEHRHSEELDLLVKRGADALARAAQLTLLSDLGPCSILQGLRVLALPDLVRMKLTSFRLSDQSQLRSLDASGLITSELESGLIPHETERLSELRSAQNRDR